MTAALQLCSAFLISFPSKKQEDEKTKVDFSPTYLASLMWLTKT